LSITGYASESGEENMLKVNPHPDYPPEEGRYLRRNDFSPVAVAIILNCDADKIPSEIENVVRAGIESVAGYVLLDRIAFYGSGNLFLKCRDHWVEFGGMALGRYAYLKPERRVHHPFRNAKAMDRHIDEIAFSMRLTTMIHPNSPMRTYVSKLLFEAVRFLQTSD
jgi:hypothetical protein